MIKPRDYLKVTIRELARWSGARLVHGRSRRHDFLKIEHGRESRKITISRSGSDAGRELKNHLARVRRALKEMGAVAHA